MLEKLIVKVRGHDTRNCEKNCRVSLLYDCRYYPYRIEPSNRIIIEFILMLGDSANAVPH